MTDTSPLITLVLADALNLLLLPKLPIALPDAVYVEATRIRGAPGAEQIVAWVNDHFDQVRIAPTDIGIDQQRRLEEHRSIRGLGEQAAVETLGRYFRSHAQDRAVLLFEDTDLVKRTAILDDRASLMSTGAFLMELEFGGLIQSADHVLDRAADRGRTVDRQRLAAREASERLRSGSPLIPRTV